MINQVLHHLDDDGADFDGHRAVFDELARVLPPGGGLIINLCSSRQIREGWWYRDLFANAFERIARRHISIARLTDLRVFDGLTSSRRVFERAACRVSTGEPPAPGDCPTSRVLTHA